MKTLYSLLVGCLFTIGVAKAQLSSPTIVPDTVYLAPHGSAFIDVLANDQNMPSDATLKNLQSISSNNFIYQNKIAVEFFDETKTKDSLIYTISTSLFSYTGVLYILPRLEMDSFQFYTSENEVTDRPGQAYCDYFKVSSYINYDPGMDYDSLVFDFSDNVHIILLPNTTTSFYYNRLIDSSFYMYGKLYKDGLRYERVHKKTPIKMKYCFYQSFYDQNRDGVYNYPIEPIINVLRSGKLTNTVTTSSYTSSNASQEPYFLNMEIGNYRADADEPSGWSFTDTNQKYVNVDDNCFYEMLKFGLRPVSDIKNVRIYTGSSSRFRLGDPVQYELSYANIGIDSAQGMITFDYDSVRLTYNQSSMLPVTVLPGKLIYSYSLAPGFEQKFTIDFTVKTPPSASINDTIYAYAEINKVGGDDSLQDNSSMVTSIVRAAYDPNEIVVFPIGEGPEKFINANDQLTYVVFFQNTGTDYAKDVRVSNVLSPYLDLNTLHFVSASHKLSQMEIDTPSRTLNFHFNEIYLLDSHTNEKASHGYFLYTINPIVGIKPGTVINNTANIYFDHNPAVVTNTIHSTVKKVFVNIREAKGSSFVSKIVPNPVKGSAEFEFTNPTNEQALLEVLDLSGRTVLKNSFKGDRYTINSADLSSGTYLYRITLPSQGISNGKIVVE